MQSIGSTNESQSFRSSAKVLWAKVEQNRINRLRLKSFRTAKRLAHNKQQVFPFGWLCFSRNFG